MSYYHRSGPTPTWNKKVPFAIVSTGGGGVIERAAPAASARATSFSLAHAQELKYVPFYKWRFSKARFSIHQLNSDDIRNQNRPFLYPSTSSFIAIYDGFLSDVGAGREYNLYNKKATTSTTATSGRRQGGRDEVGRVYCGAVKRKKGGWWTMG